MSTLAMITLPLSSANNFSSLGPRSLQGPHHLPINFAILIFKIKRKREFNRWIASHEIWINHALLLKNIEQKFECNLLFFFVNANIMHVQYKITKSDLMIE